MPWRPPPLLQNISSFPPVVPNPALQFSTRLPRDHQVQVETNDYSVNPRYVGRRPRRISWPEERKSTGEKTPEGEKTPPNSLRS